MTYVSTPRFTLGLCALIVIPLSLSLSFGCAKVVAPEGGGGSAGSGTGNAGGSGNRGTGGTGVRPDSGAGDGACQQASYTFVPKNPTVFMLVDQSGSMFKCRTAGGAMDSTGRECANRADTSWYPLRDGVLQVVQQLQAEVRFGFGAFTGEQGDAVCPALMPSLPTFNNFSAISTNYNALLAPRKGETPTTKALVEVGQILATDKPHAPGDQFILLVTDGQPDYCDDSNETCPPDSVVGELQTLSASGIKTFVFGITSPLSSYSGPTLQAFADAGAGQPVKAPLAAGKDINAFFNECYGQTTLEWRTDFDATGKPAVMGQTIGAYAAVSGAAPVYTPDPTNQQALVNQISSVLSGVKSCTFDLNNLAAGGAPILVDTTQLDRAHISIEGTEVPLDNTNGWRVNCLPAGDPACKSTQLELTGSACTTWRMPDKKNIDFNFPCGVIVPG